MTKEQILEGNKLIASFVGYKYYSYEAPDDPSQQPKAKDYKPRGWIKGDPKFVAIGNKIPKVGAVHHWLCRAHRDLRYFNEWDWLMPVVEKIEAMGFEVMICDYCCSISHALHQISNTCAPEAKSKIQAVYLSVTKFIEWHNQQKYNQR